MLLKFASSLLTFYPAVLSIVVSRVLSETIIVELSISPFNSQFLLHIFWTFIGTYMIIILFSWALIPIIIMNCPPLFQIMNFVLKFILPDISITTQAPLGVLFAWYIFPPYFQF